MLRELVAINILSIIEVDLITFNYNIIDLDLVEGKNSREVDRVEVFKVGDLIEVATTLYIIS